MNSIYEFDVAAYSRFHVKPIDDDNFFEHI